MPDVPVDWDARRLTLSAALSRALSLLRRTLSLRVDTFSTSRRDPRFFSQPGGMVACGAALS